MKQLTLFTLLIFSAFAASAENPDLKKFYGAADMAMFVCTLDANLLQLAKDNASPKQDEYATKVSDCLVQQGEKVKESFKAIPNKPENAEARESAKAVYSAWLTYGNAIAAGASNDETDHGPESRALKKALSDFRTEMDLTP